LAPLDLVDDVRCYTDPSRIADVQPTSSGEEVLVASTGGLLRFTRDGQLVDRLTRCDGLIGNTLQELAVVSDDDLWMATAQGVARLRGGRLSAYTTDEGLNDDRTYALAIDDAGTVLVGTHRGVSLFDGERFQPLNDTHELSRRPTYDIHAGDDGSIWFAKQSALSQYRGGGRWRVFQRDPVRPGPKSDIVDTSVLRVIADRRGRPWIGTSRGIGSFDEAAWTHQFHRQRRASRRGLHHNRIAALAREESGVLWIGHGDAEAEGRALGLARGDDAGWRYFDVADGLPSNRVHNVRVDATGALWIATSDGAARYENGSFATYQARGELLSNHVIAITNFDDDRVAVLTRGGLHAFRRGDEIELPPSPPAEVVSIAAANGRLHAVTAGALWVLEIDGWTRDPTLSGPMIALSAHGDDVWVLTGHGVFRGTARSWQRQTSAATSEPTRLVRLFAGPDGRAWSTAADGRLEPLGAASDLPAGHVVAHRPLLAHLSFDARGHAWLASTAGLTQLSGGARAAPAAVRDFVARTSTWDDTGRAWVGTRRTGLWRFDDGEWQRVLLHGNPFPREITSVCFETVDTLWVGTAAEGAFRIQLPAGSAS